MSAIRELRILPPLAIGRLGAARRPVDNYTAEVDARRPLGHRRLVPAETFEIDDDTGEIARVYVPDELTFKEDGVVRPVAPFLELWAVTADDVLEPVTVELLARDGLTPADVRWRTQVGNIKMFRRTKDPADRILADTDAFSDHAAHALEGRCDHFVDGAVLPLGSVRFIAPTAAHPEIRLRFTPARGYVYGSTGPVIDPGIIPEDRLIYDSEKGSWRGYFDRSSDADLTVPGAIYAGSSDAAGNWVSKGYFDDECDGIVHASLTVGDRTLAAYARIGAGPPAYAPDSFPVRTVHDELEQWMHGVSAAPADVTFERVEEILRRAFETIRLMNATVMNGNDVRGHANVASTMVRQDSNDAGRAYEPIMATSLVDTKALEQLHENLLVALRGGTAPWFVDVLRKFDEIGDLTDKGRRKMPALMRNADGRGLCLTRRQVDVVRQLAQGPIFPQEDA